MTNSQGTIAQVIVDVPLMQTDRPFSYAVPETLAGLVAPGMRVHVPFGRGNRLVQGIVIGLTDTDGSVEADNEAVAAATAFGNSSSRSVAGATALDKFSDNPVEAAAQPDVPVEAATASGNPSTTPVTAITASVAASDSPVAADNVVASYDGPVAPDAVSDDPVAPVKPLVEPATAPLAPTALFTTPPSSSVATSTAATPALKPIAELLDAEPVLSAEQLWLADEMRHGVYAYKISLLKAMLPNLLNSSYDRRLTDIATGESQLWSQMSPDERLSATARVRSGAFKLTYLAKSKENIKTEKWLSVPDPTALAATDIAKGAKRRQEAKYYFLRLTGKIRQKDVPFSSAIVKFFVENQLVKSDEIPVNRAEAALTAIKSDQAKALNPEQENAYTKIIASSKKPYLLEGITGSGKTEVYLQAIAHCLEQGQTALMLVPEISLTPLITNRFIARFGDKVAIMHSGLSDGEKYDEWRKIRDGRASVVVGARSAIFAPLKHLGIIIIDEEHESSYKQDANPRYHARDVALLRARYNDATLVLGSATPSLESRARAYRGVYTLLRLTHRASPDALLPQVQIIDMRRHMNDASANFSELLLDKIREKLARREQIILMLNRRGYSSFVMCRDCGYVAGCPNCDISLTLHMDTHTLNCHYCGHREAIPQTCPNCGSRQIRYYGSGTQKVEEELGRLIPAARVLRMDVDTTRTKHAHERLLARFGQGEADILLGTQMIAKGLDFPDVTLVGVINADTGLNLPDFRASERTFQLLMQVAGRAGRADKPGEVLIQTFNPEHYAVKLVADQDYEAFYEQEMAFRHRLAYPPYYYTIQVLVSSRSEDRALKKAYDFAQLLSSNLTKTAKILGPTPRPIARTQQLYHYQILVKYRFEDQLEPTLNQLLALTQARDNKDVRISIDSEPQNFV